MKKAPRIQPLKSSIIDAEIAEFITDVMERHEPVHTTWIVQAIVQRHQEGIMGPEAAWFLTCAYGDIRTRTRNAQRREGMIAEVQHADSQMVLTGWQHLRPSYFVEREEASQMIPIDLLTEEELFAKAHEYRIMGQGCFAHADELDRYRKEKYTAAA